MSARNWGTWNPECPAELQDLAGGFVVTPLLYSARGDSVTALPPGPDMILGPRSIDGSTITFESCHQGTRLGWRYELGGSGVTIDWTTLALGEWGLRFWVMLCIGGSDGTSFLYDPLEGSLRGHGIEVRAAKDPLLVTFHEGLEAVTEELETRGYFYLGSRGTGGGFAALRFNLEEAPAMRLVLAPGRAPRPILPATRAEQPPDPPAPAQGCLQAIHDVIAWNHVYDRVNGRPCTLATRFWNARKFGGFGLWMTDTLYNALLWSLFDPARARADLEALFDWQTEAGNFPCLVTGNDRWLDRSQPPIASFVVWCVHVRGGASDLLAWAFPRLLRNYDWWWRRRALGDSGLVAYGTSREVGDGLYKGTKLAARNESSMDNLPVHDSAPFDPESGLLLSADVGLNSLLALDGEVLALIAGALGLEEERLRLAERSERLRARIGDWLWDDQRGVFANRLLSGGFTEPLAPTSFFPLVAGAASPAQCEAMIANYLLAEDKFGGRFGLPSVTRDDPAYRDNVYWRGRIWGPLNYWTYQGLRRYGREHEAAALAESSRRLFENSWGERLCGENYNAETGAITDQADSDSFYSWGALLPVLALSELADISPWSGLSLAPSLAQGEVGPFNSPLGGLAVENRGDHWTLLRDGRALISGDLSGRMSEVALGPGRFTARLPASEVPRWLSFDDRRVGSATLDEVPLAVAQSRIVLRPCAAGARLAVRWESSDGRG